MFVKNRAEVLELCQVLDRSGVVALDTEFAAERRYFPRFDLLQVATEEVAAVIDPHASIDLGPLMERLTDPARTVIAHAGQQDLAILHRRTGKVPARVFDTQLAAAMVGYGSQIGYAALVKRVTGVNLAKTESLTDWSRRPLRPEQVEYALDDVRYLLPVHRHLEQLLIELDRVRWFEEEARRQVEPRRFEPADVRERWRRQTTRMGLTPQQALIVEEVAAWREGYAMSKDQPPRAILPDDVLAHLARRQPGHVKELREIRQIFERTVQECGGEIVAAVQRGLNRTDLPIEKESQPLPEPPAGLLELLDAVVKARARAGAIAPGLLCSGSDLERLVLDVREGRESDVELMQGWRRVLAGDDVLQVLLGKVRVGIDPESGTLKLERV